MALPAETVTGLYLGALAHNSSAAYRTRERGGWQDWSWHEVESRVSELAHGLLALGVQRGDRVGLIADTRLEWTLLDLAVLSVGAVSVPAYTASTGDDTAHILRDAGARIAVCETRVVADKVAAARPSLPALEHVIVMDGSARADEMALDRLAAMGVAHAASHREALAEARAATSPDDLLTIIYTSGTTGVPRGCLIRQRHYAAMVRIAVDVPGLVRAGDRCLLYLPLAHCFARLMPYVGMAADVTICFATGVARLRSDLVETRPHLLPTVPRLLETAHGGLQEQLATARGIRRRLGRWALATGERVSHLRQAGQRLPPGLMAQHRLGDRLLYRRVRARLGGEIRCVISGGAALDPEIARTLHAVDVLVLEGYGQTECTTAATFNRPHRYRFGTVGPALPHIDVRLAPDGEVETRGPHVFAGYHGDPEGTAAVLADGWLRTGDLGVMDDDGFLTLTGRKRDLIVLSNGKNVVPQRIEQLLESRPAIANAVVVGDRRPHLVALVTVPAAERERLGEGQRGASRQEIDAVNDELAPFEQVRRFLVLDEEFTPAAGDLTPTLKVRRGVVQARHADAIERLYEGRVHEAG